MSRNSVIHIKLILPVIFVVLVLFLFIVKGTTDIISYNVRSNFFGQYQLLANDTAETINAWLSAKKEIIENQRTALEIIGDFSSRRLSDYLSRAIIGRRDHNEICDLYFVDPDNRLMTANGYYTDPTVDLRDRPWYQNCLNTRDMYYSSPYLDLSTNSYVMTISASVHDKSGKFRGVLALDIFIDAFMNTVNYVAVPENSYIFLLDMDFGIAAHRNPEYAYVNNLPIPTSRVSGDIYADLEKTIKRGEYKMQTIRDYDGQTRDMFSSNIDCCGWSVVAAISDYVLHDPERILISAIILALFVSLSVGVLWTFIATRRIMKDLNSAMEAANAANETKSSFLANMSHEIRTPINAVIGMNEMILREDVSDTVRDYSQDISVASRSLIGIINDILDFSKIESGKLDIVENEFNIGSLINDVVSLSVSRLGDKPLELFVRADPDIPVGLIGDEIRIKQIIVNLMTNGIKYTNEGFVTLDIRGAKRDYGINLDIAVKDSGIGITPENLEKLFTSFQQINTKRNRSVEGTGLGLAITKRLVERMGGFVNVDTEYGMGSEFRVSIPLKVSDDTPFVSLSSPARLHAVFICDLSGMDVRVVDEYMRSFLYLKNKLASDMQICTDIERAKELISDGRTNVVFVDRYNYIEHEKYINEIAEKTDVYIVQNRMNAIKPPKNIKSIYKPFYAISLAAALANESSVAPVNEKSLSGTGFTAPEAKVLIVDDNIINLKVAVGLMKPYHMKVYTAESGQKAIDMLTAEQDYDIVFMDHMMPDMDGVEATGIIREKEGKYFEELPIIALTANTVNNARNMFLSAGFDEFLAKPIDTGMLDRILCRFIPDNKRVYDDATAEKNDPAPAASEKPAAPVKEEKELIFDPLAGIKYSGNMESLYIEILTEYVRSRAKMSEALRSFRDSGDWENYVIKVHALKSTSLNIGAAKLSEFAKKLEFSGKEGRFDPIINETDELLELYGKVVAQATEYLSANGHEVKIPDTSPITVTESGEGDLDDIIERFLNAVDDFEREQAMEIAGKARDMTFGGRSFRETFDKAYEYADDFDFDKAAEIVSDLKKEVAGNEQE